MASPTSGFSGLTAGISSFSNLILISPQTDIGYYAQPEAIPAGTPEPEKYEIGFLFHYEGENIATLESDITDHYVENNSAINDQIALRPLTVNVQGYIGEVNDIIPEINQLIKLAQSKLTTLSPYVPGLTTSALVLMNEAILAYQVAASAYSAVKQTIASATGSRYLTKQAKAFADFFGWYNSRKLFTIQTPWAVHTNMAIKSLRAVQSAETKMITDFEISFKQIKYVQTLNLTALAQERALVQYSAEVNSGVNNLQDSDQTIADLYGTLGAS